MSKLDERVRSDRGTEGTNRDGDYEDPRLLTAEVGDCVGKLQGGSDVG